MRRPAETTRLVTVRDVAERLDQQEHRMRRPAETTRLLTVQDVAKRLRVPVNTIYQWRTRGQGPPGFKAEGHVRYRDSDVDDWIDEQITRDQRRTGRS